MGEMIGKILIVDDDPVLCRGLQDVLETEGYKITIAGDGYQAIDKVKDVPFDLVLCDIKMPGMNGIEVLRRVKGINPEIPVIMITGFASVETAIEATKQGAYDYIIKPFDMDKVEVVIKRAISEKNLSMKNRELKKGLQASQIAMIITLAATIEAKDRYTHGHSERVATLSLKIAVDMELPEQQLKRLERACKLHDVGKLAISDRILNKPGKLSKEEWAEIRLHPVRGTELLSSLGFLKEIYPVVRNHHERHDGKGYPDRLKGEEIPLEARIVALADTFDAMTSERPYRRALTAEETAVEIERNLGSQFNPEIGEIFLTGLS